MAIHKNRRFARREHLGLTPAEFAVLRRLSTPEKIQAFLNATPANHELGGETLLSVRGLEAGEDMIRIADEKKADEIIIGIQRKSKVGKLLFGSTAQYIIMNAPCPVVTVR